MPLDSENNISNTSLDDEHSMESSTNRNSSSYKKVNKNHQKLISKHPKPTMTCVVCGDHAFGKMNLFIFSLFYLF
jgi:hypothetical protein